MLVKITKKTFNFQGLSDINEGTWEKLLAKRTVVVMNNPDRYIGIDQGNCSIEFLSMIFEAESIEKTENIARIEGEIFEGGVWVNLSFCDSLERSDLKKAIEIIESVKVLGGFDVDVKRHWQS